MDFRRMTDLILDKCMDAFGEKKLVTYYPKAGGVYEVRGIFDNEGTVFDVNTEQYVSTTQPRLGINLNDFPVDPKQGDELVLRNTRYRVQDKREDGQGGATLFLHKKQAEAVVNDTRAE